MDRFDDLARELGITRESAVRAYAEPAVRDLEEEKASLELALHMLAELLRQAAPDAIPQIRARAESASGNEAISAASLLVVAALSDRN